MKITKIDIKKFRSIDQCSMCFSDINAVVGQNNSGKSAVIRALNAFFNPESEEHSYIQGKHAYTSKSIPKIAVTFGSLGDKFEPYRDGDVLEVQQTYSSSNRRISYKYRSEGKFIAAPDELIQQIKENIAFIYIPPNRNPDQLKWEENALIKNLVEEYLKAETHRRDTLTPKFRKAAEYLENGALKRIAKEVEGYYSLRHTFNFSLSFNQNSNFMSFLNGIEMHIDELGLDHYLDDCGAGLQSLTIIALHRVLANLRHQNIILGLEEPETNLHPQAQRELINSISRSSDDDDVAQVILTTHSTVLIDNIDHLNIALVRKVPDSTRGFKSKLLKLPSTFFEDYDLEEFKYYQFHLYRNSDFFYANHVIFVESKNDAEVVKVLAERAGIDLDLYGISLINIDGVRNLSYPFHIVKKLEIPYLAILDKDYFIPYLNDELNLSRDGQGLPKYRYEYKSGIILKELIPAKSDRDTILSCMKSNHSKALDVFEKNNLVCMKYNLEMDLLCSDKAVEKMSELLSLTDQQSNRQFILEERNKAAKKLDKMLDTLRELSNQNLPNSYKRIKKLVTAIASSC
ncbi:ATP-dependent nuclease [Vibrio parahaemolyticus]|uniref:ATP-dependent nuclease n=1 Tax=Vibrio parahaemolyticus TaxID=670 RepID=UPI0004139D2A|nr:AAA family ATPase [Vibrio parahaemolyticus]ELB2137273.1 AAA family ATPase [Vibrio parahaemolyticus]MCQ9048899.1 AAA family ATPase [Vibrio parahaemolyticus]HCG5490246.1 AAA family ATPase [Vibrio parahaemolyticus]